MPPSPQNSPPSAGHPSATTVPGAEPHFRRLLDALPAAAYTCDADGLITRFNHHAQLLWGRAPAVLDPADRYCGSFRLYATDGTPIPHDQCWMARALQTGAEYSQEIVIERPDGGRRTALANASPIRDEAGRVVGAVNLLIDISDRVTGDEARSRLAAIVESSDDAIISKTLDGRILSWNAAAQRLFGYTADEAIGRSITMLIPPELQDEEEAILTQIRRGERVEHYETVRMAKDGSRLDISLTSSPVRDGTGRIIGASKVARDVTARKQNEAALLAVNTQLRNADHFRNQFLATLAHELRNPMAPIQNAVEILARQTGLPTEARWATDVIGRQLGQLTRLVGDLLDVGRITANKLELQKARIDLADAVRLAVETSRPKIDAAGHELVLTMLPEPIALDADLTRLAQVIANLLNNAATYSERGGRIWLTVRRDGGEAVVSVRDTGIGIAPAMMSGIFEMFQQGQRPPEQPPSGLGIGLSLVERLVTMHGGTVSATSDGPGRGSEFTIRLPVVSAARGAAQEQNGASPLLAASARRVLIVDDNRESADSLSVLLRMAGHETHVAYDGLEAVARAGALRPEIVLLDVGLPGLDGYEAARAIRAQVWGEPMVLIAITGWGHDAAMQRSAAAGFDQHLVKPVHPAVLAQLLASAERQAPPAASA